MKYIHFTDEDGARGIEQSGELWASSVTSSVFAIPVGGTYSPKTQETKIGRAKSRDYAVIFTTNELPDGCFPEECYWDTKSLDVKVDKIVPREEAVKLLDNSLPEDPDAEPWSANTLLIPTKANPDPKLESIVRQQVGNVLNEILKEQEEEEPLYHVTHYNRLPMISKQGLVPGAGRSIGGAAYDTHSGKGIFLTEPEGIKFWFSRAEEFAEHQSDNPLEDGFVPVVLKIKGITEEELEDDELGSQDAKEGSYIFSETISPQQIEVWSGQSWIPVSNWDEIETEQAFEFEEDDLVFFKTNNPLMP